MGFRFINNLAVSNCIAGNWLPENQGALNFFIADVFKLVEE